MKDLAPVVCLSFAQWDTPYVKSTFKLMEALSAHRRILVADYPYTWKDIAEAVAGKKPHVPWRRCLGLSDRMREFHLPKSQDLVVLNLPPVLPVNHLPEGDAFQRLTAWEGCKLAGAIRKALQQLGWGAPVVFNAFQPVFGLPLAGRLGELKRIYYAYDEIGAANWAGKHGPLAEQTYLRTADLVVASSSGLQNKFSFLHPHTLWVPNGVDPAFFEPELAPPLPEGPWHAGFVGSIDDRLDVPLLSAVMGAMPGWTFHFLGRVVDPGIGAAIAGHANARLHGPQPPEALPQWLKKFQVGLLPYVRNAFTGGIYPMKLHEYFAAGLPVASTVFGDMPLFERQALLSNTPEEWIRQLIRMVAEDTPEQRQARRAFARDHTWARRAAQLEAAIVELLHDLSPSASPARAEAM